ncbi:MAG: hypothetical protein AAGI54_00325 [Planctomycetota bacterium]
MSNDSLQRDASPSVDKRFLRLNAFGALGLSLYLIIALVITFAKFSGDSSAVGGQQPFEFAAGYFAGVLIGGFIIGGVVAFVTWLISRRNSASNIAFMIALGVAALGQISSYFAERSSDRVVEEMQADQDQALDQMVGLLERSVAGEDVSEESKALREGRLGRLETAAQETQGLQSVMYAAMAKAMRPVNDQRAVHESSIQQFMEVGGFDTSTIGSLAEIDERLTRLMVFHQANEELDRRIQATPDRLRQAIIDSGVSIQIADRAAVDFSTGFQPVLQERLRDTDRRAAQGMQSMLETLKAHWGNWEVDQSGMLLFQDDAALVQFNAAHEKLQTAIAEQERLSQEIIEAVKRIQ